jgi:hypothetical protein
MPIMAQDMARLLSAPCDGIAHFAMMHRRPPTQTLLIHGVKDGLNRIAMPQPLRAAMQGGGVGRGIVPPVLLRDGGAVRRSRHRQKMSGHIPAPPTAYRTRPCDRMLEESGPRKAPTPQHGSTAATVSRLSSFDALALTRPISCLSCLSSVK